MTHLRGDRQPSTLLYHALYQADRLTGRVEAQMRGKQIAITAVIALAVVLGYKYYEQKRG